MQHHKQPIVTDILTTANKLHNQNDVETSIQWIPGHCDIPGNDRADTLARQGTSKTQHDEQTCLLRYIQADRTNKVSEDLAWQVGSWQHWTDLLPAPTNSKPDRPHQPTTQSTPDCRISPQNTPCTAERTPKSHQEGTSSKVCLLPRQWWDRWTFPVLLPTVRQHQIQTTASSTKYTHHAIWIHYTTATNSQLQHVSHEQRWRDCPKSGGPRKVKVKRLSR